MTSVTMNAEQKKYIKERLSRLAPSWRPRGVTRIEPAKVKAARALISQYEKDEETANKEVKARERAEFHKLERAVVFTAAPADALKALDAYEAKYPKIED